MLTMFIFILSGWFLMYISEPYRVGYIIAYKNWWIGSLGIFSAMIGCSMPLFYYGSEKEENIMYKLYDKYKKDKHNE
jgi:hypothetical protein